MINKFLRYILGEFIIKINCSNPEQLINELLNSKYKIYGIKKISNDELTFRCDFKTFKRISDGCMFQNLNFEIITKKGFPQFIFKYKKRYGILIGLIIFISTLYLSSLFIWDIDVAGNKTLSDEFIINELSELGFVSGKYKKHFNIKDIENSFLSDNSNVSWISINLKGTVAFVEVRENTKKPTKIDTSKPSNIYACRDGVIGEITTYMGYKTVQPGDTVTVGDIVVTGEYTDKYGKNYLLHSYAKVMAFTTHSHTVKVPYKTIEQQPTGRFKKNYSLKLTRFTLPLYFNENIYYNKYSKNINIKKFKLSSSFVLPFSIVTTTYLETNEIEYHKSKDAALLDAYEKLEDIERNLIGIRVIDKNYEVLDEDDGIVVKARYNCYEDIGIEKEIC